MKFHEEYVVSAGLKLYMKWANPAGARTTVLFLHGFPDDHETWSNQLEALGRKYRVAALELRGVNRSQRPKKGSQYAVRNILPDISRAIESLGGEKVHLVGHDWGSMIGWCYATDPIYSQNLISYQGMSAPHPGTILTYMGDKLKAFKLGPLGRQLIKSWYVWFFQIPWLPEYSIRKLSPEWRGRLLQKGGMTSDDPLVLKSREQFAAITTGAVNLYRQLLRRRPGKPAAPTIPTQQIIPSGDLFVSTELYHGQARLLAGNNYREVPVKGPHWIHRTEPAQINRILVDFIEEQEKKIRSRNPSPGAKGAKKSRKNTGSAMNLKTSKTTKKSNSSPGRQTKKQSRSGSANRKGVKKR
ncbi:MAG TPA: hypothetical protein DEA96_02675 [Leptospiraceae bacterium]|nr:hypothetical protein [Spirochaetaceae bacterium]HBS03841.1 hypothetical protein [Leptospiraceae bacterium]|tara:strand:- start:1187 stop:2254 length:1068 start_codon:yes stop_codon:yes gene_type:complete